MGSTDLANSCSRGSAAFERDLRGKAGLALCTVGWPGRKWQGGADTAGVRVSVTPVSSNLEQLALAQGKASLHNQRLQLMLSCRPSSSLEDKQGSDL